MQQGKENRVDEDKAQTFFLKYSTTRAISSAETSSRRCAKRFLEGKRFICIIYIYSDKDETYYLGEGEEGKKK